jgi:hypothetical protein
MKNVAAANARIVNAMTKSAARGKKNKKIPNVKLLLSPNNSLLVYSDHGK